MRRSDKNSMDPISLPDKDKINGLQGGFVSSKRVHKETGIDDFTNFVKPNFDNAAPVKVPERKEPEPEKDELDEYLEEMKQREERINRGKGSVKGVKVGKKYVASWLIKRIVIIVVLALFVVITFLPPVMISSSEGQTLQVNVFENVSVPYLKEEILSNWNVYELENMSSERAENYRVCTVGIEVKNFSPYSVELEGFRIVTCDPTYKDKFIAVKPIQDEISISPFKVTTVEVQILINVSELSEEQFNEAMTSLIISTSGLRKKIGPIPIPTVPAYIFVSDSLEFKLN